MHDMPSCMLREGQNQQKKQGDNRKNSFLVSWFVIRQCERIALKSPLVLLQGGEGVVDVMDLALWI
jgi:hypothetical protein